MSYLTDNLLMATVSASKVSDVAEVVDEAERAVGGHLVAADKRRQLASVLERIKNTQADELTEKFKHDVTNVLDEAVKIVVSQGGEVKVELNTIEGTEWRDQAIHGCESVIDELTRGIKRWTNQLSAKFNEVWTANFYAVDTVKKRLSEIDNDLASLKTPERIKDTLTVPAGLDKSFLVDYKSILTKSNIDAIILGEVNYLFTAIKFWNLETIEFKNRAIKFFGNKARGPLSTLDRHHPRFFSKKAFVDENDSQYVYYTPPRPFIGGGGIWFCESTHKEDTLVDKMHRLDASGYNIVQSSDTNHTRAKETDITPLSIKQLEKLFDCVSKIVDISETLNKKNNEFDLSDKDAKDVLKTITETQDETIITAFSSLFVHYQLDVSATQSGFIRYLYQLANHVITFIALNLACYRSQSSE